MVNCKNCGAPLSLNDAVCPHCGTPNPEAQEHLRKLEALDRKFETTTNEVRDQVKKSNKGYRVLVILTMILLANLILIPFHMASYDIADRIRVSVMGDKEVREKLDTLLEEGEFAELYLFMDQYNLPYQEYREHSRISSLASHYVYFLRHLTNWRYNTEIYSDPLIQACRDITEFKTDYKNYFRWAEDTDPVYINAAKQLSSDFDAAAKEYLKLTDEDLKEAESMTDSALLVRVNERLNDEADK